MLRIKGPAKVKPSLTLAPGTAPVKTALVQHPHCDFLLAQRPPGLVSELANTGSNGLPCCRAASKQQPRWHSCLKG